MGQHLDRLVTTPNGPPCTTPPEGSWKHRTASCVDQASLRRAGDPCTNCDLHDVIQPTELLSPLHWEEGRGKAQVLRACRHVTHYVAAATRRPTPARPPPMQRN